MKLDVYYRKADSVVGVAKIIYNDLADTYNSIKLSNIAKTTSGGTPKRGNPDFYNGDIPWLKSGELNDSVITKYTETITQLGLDSSSAKLFPKETLLVAMYGATAGKCGILGFDSATNQAVCSIYPNEKVLRDYLFWFFRQYRIDYILMSKGGAQPNISQTVIKNTLLPVPPIKVQHKIINALNEIQKGNLVALDFISEESSKRIKKFYTAREVDTELSHSLVDQKQLITQLRQSILQEAIQGKLTQEWRAEQTQSGDEVETASQLLTRIKAEKAQLIKDKKIKKEKPLPPITEEDLPFELPEGWVWCRLGDICSKTGSGSTPKGGKAAYPSSGIKFLRSQNVYDDGLHYDGIVFIPKETHERMKGTKVQASDLLLNITGGSIGRCCIVPKDFDTGNINQHVAIIRTVEKSLGYLVHKVICSPYFQKMILDVQTGAGREGLPKNKMDNILIPFPSLAEQQVIVSKVESLMQKVDALGNEIKESESNAALLMQAVLKEAFEK